MQKEMEKKYELQYNKVLDHYTFCSRSRQLETSNEVIMCVIQRVDDFEIVK